MAIYPAKDQIIMLGKKGQTDSVGCRAASVTVVMVRFNENQFLKSHLECSHSACEISVLS